MNFGELLLNLAVVFTLITAIVTVLVLVTQGKNGIYRALVWLYLRRPNHILYTCQIYHLDPAGPWEGVCVNLCEFYLDCKFLGDQEKAIEQAEKLK